LQREIPDRGVGRGLHLSVVDVLGLVPPGSKPSRKRDGELLIDDKAH
jgi:hypothetical protein